MIAPPCRRLLAAPHPSATCGTAIALPAVTPRANSEHRVARPVKQRRKRSASEGPSCLISGTIPSRYSKRPMIRRRLAPSARMMSLARRRFRKLRFLMIVYSQISYSGVFQPSSVPKRWTTSRYLLKPRRMPFSKRKVTFDRFRACCPGECLFYGASRNLRISRRTRELWSVSKRN